MRHVLVASLGMAAPILTETLWAMMNPRLPPEAQWEDPAISPKPQAIVPQVVHVVRTALWDAEKGYALHEANCALIVEKVKKLYASFGHPEPDIRIEAVQDPDGGEQRFIPDVSTQIQNILFANHMTRVIKHYTDEPDTVLHVSLAAGRKSMSSYAHTALMFFGRPQDTLSHTLVHPAKLEVAGNQFWWPDEPGAAPFIEIRKSLKSEETEAIPTTVDGGCRVDLIPVPFARLNVRLPDTEVLEDIDYARVVQFAEMERRREQVVFDFPRREVVVGNWRKRFSESGFILLCLLALARHQRWPGPLNDRPGWIMQSDFGRGLVDENTAKSTLALAAFEELTEAVIPWDALLDRERRPMLDAVNVTDDSNKGKKEAMPTSRNLANLRKVFPETNVPDAVILLRPDSVQRTIRGAKTSIVGLNIDPDRLNLDSFPEHILRLHDTWKGPTA